VLGGWLAGRAGLPSGYLFAALVVGLVLALARPGAVGMPRAGFVAGQAVTGVVLGTYLHTSTLTGLGSRWIPVLLVSAATLGLTTAIGVAMGRLPGLDRVTASLGTVAGGASGIVAMTDELGGDDRLVAFMQYLRVLVIVLLTPLFVKLAFPGHASAAGASGEGPLLGDAGGWLLVAVAAPIGAWAGRRVRLPAGALLGPMFVAAALTLSGVADDVQIPALLREAAFSAIGLQIGLNFTMDTVRLAGRLLVPVLVSIAVLVAGCFGLAWALEQLANVSLLDAYLATTPGGLYAVLPIAFGSGANTTFVLAVQGLRLLVMVLAAPLLVRWLVRRQER
jgi:membrane AbrB-like protein